MGAPKAEVFTAIIDVAEIRFLERSGDAIVNVVEKGGEERVFGSKLEHIIELAHQLDGAERLRVDYTESVNKRRFTNRYIEDLAVPTAEEELAVVAAATPGTPAAVSTPADLDERLLTMRAAELAVELVKLDDEQRRLAVVAIPSVLHVFKSSASLESIHGLAKLLGAPTSAQGKQPESAAPVGTVEYVGGEWQKEVADEDDVPLADLIDQARGGY
jgi:hypothetical protein